MTMMMVDHDEVKQILYLYSSNTFFFLELENMSNKLFSPDAPGRDGMRYLWWEGVMLGSLTRR